MLSSFALRLEVALIAPSAGRNLRFLWDFIEVNFPPGCKVSSINKMN